MSPILLPGAINSTSIVVETRRGTPIPNEQYYEFTPFEQGQFQVLGQKYRTVIYRSEANPVYNCHGMTFASRRTWIIESDALELILREDGYQRIQRGSVLPGDVVLYQSNDGDIEHSGIIVEVSATPPQLFRIVSKWGKFREVLHWESDCPYDASNLSFYRIR